VLACYPQSTGYKKVFGLKGNKLRWGNLDITYDLLGMLADKANGSSSNS
jgi:hypothetical protein